uniref:Protein farnesyltransferase/geranylgeranyltransferase type-1 subunit alpha n=1 Tax=Timema tahoe TaxID=61484 RepID=A0A7R9P1C0_9NEOP|nr:unnamed protein product [Timema tahoe]
MASSSTEELCEESSWILYKDREEWKDVTPVPQDDGPNTVVSILYTEKFKDVYDYFRAVLKSNEKSERALELTKDALDLNPANYTVWQYRSQGSFCDVTVSAQSAATNCMAVYGAPVFWSHISTTQSTKLGANWLDLRAPISSNLIEFIFPRHHRGVIVNWLQEPSQELQVTRMSLNQDAKNYHAWQHRQWVLRKFKLLIHHEKGLSRNERVIEFCEELYTSGIRSPYLLGFLVDIYGSMEKGGGDKPHTFQKALEICDALAKEHDTIRREYWNFIACNITQQMNTSNGEEFLGASRPSELVMETS